MFVNFMSVSDGKTWSRSYGFLFQRVFACLRLRKSSPRGCWDNSAFPTPYKNPFARLAFALGTSRQGVRAVSSKLKQFPHPVTHPEVAASRKIEGSEDKSGLGSLWGRKILVTQLQSHPECLWLIINKEEGLRWAESRVGTTISGLSRGGHKDSYCLHWASLMPSQEAPFTNSHLCQPWGTWGIHSPSLWSVFRLMPHRISSGRKSCFR